MKNQYQEYMTKIWKINTRRTGQKYEKSTPGVHDKYQEPAPGWQGTSKKSIPRGHDKYEKSTPGGQDKDMKNQYQEDMTKIWKINTMRTGQKYEK